MLKDAWFPAVRPEMFTSWFLAFFSCWWLSGSRVWDDPFQLDQRRSQKICNSVEMAWDRDQIYIYTYKLKGYLVRNSFGIHWLDDLEALMESKMLEETLQFIPLAGKKGVHTVLHDTFSWFLSYIYIGRWKRNPVISS